MLSVYIPQKWSLGYRCPGCHHHPVRKPAGGSDLQENLERRNINVFIHYFTKGYPTDVDLIVSEEGYGSNDYIKTKKPLVVVTGPGPGKMATCLTVEDRAVVIPSREAAGKAKADPRLGNDDIHFGAAIQLKDGTIIQVSNSPRMHAASSAIVRSIKYLTGIPSKINLIPDAVCDSVKNLKTNILGEKNPSMDLQETLIAMEGLKEFNGCEIHMTHMPSPGDEEGLRRLGINLTTEAVFATDDLYTL